MNHTNQSFESPPSSNYTLTHPVCHVHTLPAINTRRATMMQAVIIFLSEGIIAHVSKAYRCITFLGALKENKELEDA
jgi:hypothetical protein